MTYPFSVKKVPALPVQLAPTTIYFVKPVGGVLSLHITNTVPEVTYVATHVNDINQVVKAMLHTPNGATNPSNPVQYITKTGFSLEDLNAVMDIPNGIPRLDAEGKIAVSQLPLYNNAIITNIPIITGPASLLYPEVGTYYITNYDINNVYTLTSKFGTAVRNGGTITFTPTITSGLCSFTLNNRVTQIEISSSIIITPNKPSISLPVNNEQNKNKTISYTSTEYTITGAFNVHHKSEWQLATEPDFTNIIYTTAELPANMYTWTVGDLTPNTTYYSRVRYLSTNGQWSLWSDITTVKTREVFVPITEEAKILSGTIEEPTGHFAKLMICTKDGSRLLVSDKLAINNITGLATGAVYVYFYNGVTWIQEAKLVQDDPNFYSYFGSNTTIDDSGSRIVVAGVNPGANNAYWSLYTFKRIGTNWYQESIIPHNGSVNYLGSSILKISHDGNTLIANQHSSLIVTFSYVNGVWNEVNQSTIPSFQYYSTDANNTTLCISYVNVASPDPITIQIYKRNTITNVWTLSSTISNLSNNNPSYVATLSMSDDGLSIAASIAAAKFDGLFLFRWVNNAWVTHSVPVAFGDGGRPVKISADGTRILFSNRTSNVYKFNGTNIVLEHSSPNLSNNSMPSIQSDGDIKNIFNGMWDYRVNSLSLSAVEVMVREYGSVTHKTILRPADVNGFGYSLSVNAIGDRLVVGAHDSSITISSTLYKQVGSAYVFKRTGTTWALEGRLIPNDRADFVNFGNSVSINAAGDRIAVGAMNSDTSATDSGAVYIFSRSVTTWTQESKIVAATPVAYNRFGTSVALDSTATRILIGTPNSDTPGAIPIVDNGATYVYIRSGSTWTLETILTAVDKIDSDYFGHTVDIDATGTRAVIGSYGSDPNSITNSGAAYVYRRSGTTWIHEAKLIAADGAAGDNFGYSVAIDDAGSRIAVGAINHDANGVNAGAVYVYARAMESWILDIKLLPSDPHDGDNFGSAVAMDTTGTRLAVGASINAGSSYLYACYNTVWREEAVLVPTLGNTEKQFGQAVAISAQAERAFVSAPADFVNAGVGTVTAYII